MYFPLNVFIIRQTKNNLRISNNYSIFHFQWNRLYFIRDKLPIKCICLLIASIISKTRRDMRFNITQTSMIHLGIVMGVLGKEINLRYEVKIYISIIFSLCLRQWNCKTKGCSFSRFSLITLSDPGSNNLSLDVMSCRVRWSSRDSSKNNKYLMFANYIQMLAFQTHQTFKSLCKKC